MQADAHVLAGALGASPYVKRNVPLAIDPVTVCALVQVHPSDQGNCVPVHTLSLPSLSAPANDAESNVSVAGPSLEHG